MELFSRLPDDLKGLVLPYTLWNASSAQVELFKTLPSEVQGYVLKGKPFTNSGHSPVNTICWGSGGRL